MHPSPSMQTGSSLGKSHDGFTSLRCISPVKSCGSKCILPFLFFPVTYCCMIFYCIDNWARDIPLPDSLAGTSKTACWASGFRSNFLLFSIVYNPFGKMQNLDIVQWKFIWIHEAFGNELMVLECKSFVSRCWQMKRREGLELIHCYVQLLVIRYWSSYLYN